ncbi:MAG: hypothetical protein IKZ85_08980 [Pseudobutyrivibrio sp.]|nr:hypothetical protein [Pseudobutyrivibrio sp.]
MNLLRKAISGMQLDKIIKDIEDNFTRVFGEDIRICEVKSSAENMGYFQISTCYVPSDYKIILEHSEGIFNIFILDATGARATLSAHKKYNPELCADNIENALVLLKQLLEENDFVFLLAVNDKYYYKNSRTGEMRRVSKKELLNAKRRGV